MLTQTVTAEPKPVQAVKADHYILYFTASWCGPCQRMKATTWKDKKVLALAKGFAGAKYNGRTEHIHILDEADAKTNKVIAKTYLKYQIQSFPTVLIVNKKTGRVAKKAVGYMSPKDMQRFLADVPVTTGKVVPRIFGESISIRGLLILFFRFVFSILG
jgi:thiol-disulfide isomerase/thioredoxin